MGLDALRAQNRVIEEYVMRLVRQRDELKQVTKLAEEQDSYFILGLEGPHVSESAVKKAYRNLARKEHPDKAGVGNKKRFQSIQHAYASILKQRKGDAGVDTDSGGASASAQRPSIAPSAAAQKAAANACQAKDAADRVAAVAHRSLRAAEAGPELQGLPKRKALRALRELARQGAAELRETADKLRELGGAACGVSDAVEDVLTEQGSDAASGAGAIGLRDQAMMVQDAGQSCVSSAELLTKISEATEATVKKVEAADTQASSGDGRGRGDDTAALVRLGVRLLGESLTRTSAVARRSADDAITAAMKALELSRSIAALVAERREKKREEDKDDDAPMAAPDAEKRSEDSEEGGANPGEQKDRKSSKDEAREAKGQPTPEPSPRDPLQSAAKRVKDRHVALRVKNLRFLSSLNEETLRAQCRLRALLERSSGALLPEVTVEQKVLLFDFVSQLLDAATADAARLASNSSVPPARMLERCMAFALALEHERDVAMPIDARTQVLKLATLVDSDLLCQVIEGHFCQRLVGVGARLQSAEHAGGSRARSVTRAYPSAGAGAGNAGNAAAVRAWTDASRACCTRLAEAIRTSKAHNGSTSDEAAVGGQYSADTA
eukprot:TRINITY_DN1620_c1_g1_i2.p1 TRINITY_DN1620_c1_g1~~TRINITY_DN1620_c1_g1_i2.p1  ORF type:complete len:611 (+),score=109.84 TRINITY_DN1620_c1_g1_i2:164-1996(+)